MKLKKRIQKLEAKMKELKNTPMTDSITLIDSVNPNCKVKLSLINGDFSIQKITTETKENIDLILKDNK